MLTRRSAPGYDLLKATERSVGFFWTPAKSQLYALLPKLVERGLLRAEADRAGQAAGQDALPDHEGGPERHCARGWSRPPPAVDRNPFELRVFFGEHMRPGAVRAMIEARRDQARAHLAILEEIERDPAVVADTYPYLTLLAGKENAKAAIRWAEQALQILDERT